MCRFWEYYFVQMLKKDRNKSFFIFYLFQLNNRVFIDRADSLINKLNLSIWVEWWNRIDQKFY